MNLKLNKNVITFSINYITNFNPFIFNEKLKKKLFKLYFKKKILCRNFFLFIILLKYFKYKNIFNNITIFVKPFRKKLINLLRAPYKNKLSRYQITIKRFNISINISIVCIDILFNKVNDIFIFLNILKKFYKWFESNIIYLHKSKIIFNFFFKNNFLIKINNNK